MGSIEISRRPTQARRYARNHRVAAVCYRLREGQIEFLLVQSRAGRWTFPKGRVDDDPSFAAAAAREAIEEAGAYGRVDSDSFVSYIHAKNPNRVELSDEQIVDAHLFEVAKLVAPEESFRNPTWFSPRRSKLMLHEKRSASYGSELARVVDRAVERIYSRGSRRRALLN